MFFHAQTNNSWFYMHSIGRSSDLKLSISFHLPKSFDSVIEHLLEMKLPFYSDEFVQDFHLIPFSPEFLLRHLFCFPTSITLAYLSLK